MFSKHCLPGLKNLNLRAFFNRLKPLLTTSCQANGKDLILKLFFAFLSLTIGQWPAADHQRPRALNSKFSVKTIHFYFCSNHLITWEITRNASVLRFYCDGLLVKRLQSVSVKTVKLILIDIWLTLAVQFERSITFFYLLIRLIRLTPNWALNCLDRCKHRFKFEPIFEAFI